MGSRQTGNEQKQYSEVEVGLLGQQFGEQVHDRASPSREISLGKKGWKALHAVKIIWQGVSVEDLVKRRLGD